MVIAKVALAASLLVGSLGLGTIDSGSGDLEGGKACKSNSDCGSFESCKLCHGGSRIAYCCVAN
jgi:hypothetical protein